MNENRLDLIENRLFKYLGKNLFHLIATFLLINGAMEFKGIN